MTCRGAPDGHWNGVRLLVCAVVVAPVPRRLMVHLAHLLDQEVTFAAEFPAVVRSPDLDGEVGHGDIAASTHARVELTVGQAGQMLPATAR